LTHIASPVRAVSSNIVQNFLSQPIPPAMPAYANVETIHNVTDRTFWCYLKPEGRPSFTAGLLSDLHLVQAHIAFLAEAQRRAQPPSVDWVVLASRVPGIFNLGGDLTLFAEKIREGDRAGLRDYAYSCVDISHRNCTAYGGNAITIGLAQGDALGGGFESLLSCDVLVAERRARFGLPEVLMNLFPGMGAHCFLTRKIGSAAALKLILSGQVFTAEAMHAIGVVDILAENDAGEEAVREHIARASSRHRAQAAIYKARRQVSPVSLQDLRDVTDIWIDTAMALTPQDLRRMTHLVAAQDRSLRRQ
jgi:DSF synthase